LWSWSWIDDVDFACDRVMMSTLTLSLLIAFGNVEFERNSK
jgi:hypothetical protein